MAAILGNPVMIKAYLDGFPGNSADKPPQGHDANWSRLRATMDVDFGQMELVPGLKFHISALWQGGGNLGSYIGSIPNPSSMVSPNATRLDSWWLEVNYV